ncbi:beta-galactosidase [Paenibacillus sp. alder61]|uniref:beta-galactosidase n=1 Tax=Paenibacillus sp. alder61 TaxID=2862948 RepID=UPI001CD4BA99|nr:beta-galactosidase [Paenibacillus sp. alder61]MCA1296496.1 beta-galactosidase [Paenibacillus sp. alder61]
MRRKTWQNNAVRIGVDYYPEQWDPGLWEEDIQLMKVTGVRIARVAEFAWSRLEPSSGIYQFDWLDRALDLFHKYGISVVIGTPTNTPPRWLTDLRPDILPVFADGRIYHPGVRGHRCFNSESIRVYGSRIVEKMAEHFGKHPAVIGWQTDNEFGMLDCHCPRCNAAFREWVKRKYGSIAAVNRAWGTVVWSGEYSDWCQIGTPLGGSPHQNPSYLLDYARFQWDAVASFQGNQIKIIREHCPHHFVTHNFHSYPQRLDLHRVGKDLDFAAFDYYPNTSPGKQSTGPYSGALSLDVTRGIKRRNFWIMEQLSGPPGCWFPMWRSPYPGFIRAYAWQAIARGADAVVHFRWRSAVAGAEQFWHGLIDHSNVPGRKFDEFASLCAEVNMLSKKIKGTVLKHEAAILMSAEQLEALRIQPQAEGLDYYENIKDYHRALTKLGIGCDVIEWSEPLDGYKLVVAPSLYLLDAETACRLERFASEGGVLVLTSRTGVKDMNNQCVMSPLPGLLSSCSGVTVTEYDPIGQDMHELVDDNGRTFKCSQWCDILAPLDAEVLLRYAGDFYAGQPAVTVNRFGQGEVYYLGTHPEEAWLKRLFGDIAARRDIPAFPELPDGVQVTIRTAADRAVLFVLNLSREVRRVTLPTNYYSLLDAEFRGKHIELAPYGVDILEIAEQDQS